MPNPHGSPQNLRPPFSKTNQPANRGRKPSSIKKFIKDNNLNYNDVSAMAKYILPLNENQIMDLAADKNKPLVMRVFARSVLQDIKKGNLQNVMILIERAVGKPKEIQETYTPAGPEGLTKEEREARAEELIKKRNREANGE